MVIKKIIKVAAKKGLKSKSKARKVRSHPKPKVKSKATIERDRNQKKFVAMHKKVQAKRKTKSVTIPRKRKYVAPPPRKDGLQDKELFSRPPPRGWDGISPTWRKGYAEKGKRSMQRELWEKKRASAWKGRTDARSWGSFDKGIETKRSGGKYGAYVGKPRTYPYEEHRLGWNPYVGKKPIRKVPSMPRTVAGLDKTDLGIVGLTGAGVLGGYAVGKNDKAIDKAAKVTMDKIAAKKEQLRIALLRRLGLI